MGADTTCPECGNDGRGSFTVEREVLIRMCGLCGHAWTINPKPCPKCGGNTKPHSARSLSLGVVMTGRVCLSCGYFFQEGE